MGSADGKRCGDVESTYLNVLSKERTVGANGMCVAGVWCVMLKSNCNVLVLQAVSEKISSGGPPGAYVSIEWPVVVKSVRVTYDRPGPDLIYQ